MYLDKQSRHFLRTAKNEDIIYSLKSDIEIYKKQKQFTEARYLQQLLVAIAANIIAKSL